MADVESTRVLLDRLTTDRSLDPLKQLLYSHLNYDRDNQPLPVDAWTERQREGLAAEPLRIAGTEGQLGRFDVIYSALNDWSKARGFEREVVGRLLRDHPLALFVFSDEAQRQWHFVNVKYAKDDTARRLFRRITVAPGERLRTASERISLLDLGLLPRELFGYAPLAVQTRHDDAFDVEAVTRQFFREYDRVFRSAEAQISGIPDEPRRLFTQKLFNRLMFIVFLERKGWLKLNDQRDRDYLQALWQDYLHNEAKRSDGNFYLNRLRPLFFAGLNNASEINVIGIPGRSAVKDIIGSVPYLNGGLFERGEDDENQAIRVPDSAIRPAIDDLFYHFNFTVTESTPFDVEVAVDPEMLGKIFEELVTGRHESGSYYTPKTIVSFMGREALKGYLQTACQDKPDAIAAFVDNLDASRLGNPEKALEALKSVRICDPACGSGAYLLGMMQELLELRQALFTAKELDDTTVYNRKLEIIQNNVYGVDIDPFAVSVARLRLWLSLVVDWDDGAPPPLPNLDYKVEVGDSLLGPAPNTVVQLDLFCDAHIDEFQELKAKYLESHGEEKLDLRRQIVAKREELRDCLPQRAGAELAQGFDWGLEFAEVFVPRKGKDGETQTGGFDIVLANPPYVRQEQIKAIKPALKQVYGNLFVGTADLYTYFYFRGLQLLKPRGELVFISSNKWLRAGYGEKLREHLKQNTTLRTVIDFGDLPVFGAIAYPLVIAAHNAPAKPVEKGKEPPARAFRALTVKDMNATYTLTDTVARTAWEQPQDSLESAGWALTQPEMLALLTKLKKAGTPLGEYVDGKIYRGVLTGFNEAFVIDAATRTRLIAADPKSAEVIKPWLRGRDVKRWRVEWAGLYIIAIQNSGDANANNPWANSDTENKARAVFKRTYPAIHDHVSQYENPLRVRQDQGRFWWELRACAYYGEFEKPKIVWGNLAQRAKYAYDDQMNYINAPANILPADEQELPILLALLNSRVADFLMQWAGAVRQGGFLEYKPMYVSQIPIPDADQPLRDGIATVVRELLAAASRNSRTEALEVELNRLAYQAYGLTLDEIALIEGEASPIAQLRADHPGEWLVIEVAERDVDTEEPIKGHLRAAAANEREAYELAKPFKENPLYVFFNESQENKTHEED